MWQDSTQQVLSQSISFFMNQINSPIFLFLLMGIIIIILRLVFYNHTFLVQFMSSLLSCPL